jgi:hypothetical protein
MEKEEKRVYVAPACDIIPTVDKMLLLQTSVQVDKNHFTEQEWEDDEEMDLGDFDMQH